MDRFGGKCISRDTDTLILLCEEQKRNKLNHFVMELLFCCYSQPICFDFRCMACPSFLLQCYLGQKGDFIISP